MSRTLKLIGHRNKGRPPMSPESLATERMVFGWRFSSGFERMLGFVENERRFSQDLAELSKLLQGTQSNSIISRVVSAVSEYAEAFALDPDTQYRQHHLPMDYFTHPEKYKGENDVPNPASREVRMQVSKSLRLVLGELLQSDDPTISQEIQHLAGIVKEAL